MLKQITGIHISKHAFNCFLKVCLQLHLQFSQEVLDYPVLSKLNQTSPTPGASCLHCFLSLINFLSFHTPSCHNLLSNVLFTRPSKFLVYLQMFLSHFIIQDEAHCLFTLTYFIYPNLLCSYLTNFD